jgi:NAD(P)-dependent dehydrogenase (short-subunit alcohol dehydrogenase family)
VLLQNKASAVTGSGQGIGRAIAKALAAEGASVVVNDINFANAEKVAAEIVEAGGRAVADGSDISTMHGAEAMVNHCVEAFSGIDILVNNAGILRDRMSFNMSEEEWDAVQAVCLKGTFACTKFASNHMRAQGRGGRIINIASRSGLRGNVGQANYAAAKAGVLGFTRTVCQELKKYGITVNAISPRAVTDMTNSVPEEVKKKKDASWVGTSVRKRGEPENVAPLAVFLALDESDWINGQVVGLGGDKLSLWSHPHEVAEAFIFGGWNVDNLRSLFKTSVGYELQSVGNKD